MSKRPILISLAAVIIAVMATGCTADTNNSGAALHGLPSRWIASDTDDAGYLQWTLTGSHVSGQLTYTYLTTPSSTTTQTNTASFTGEISNGNVTLTLPEGLGAVSSLTGEISGSALTLDFPANNGTIQELTFHGGTIRQYNQLVSDLERTATNNDASAQAASTPEGQSPSTPSSSTAAKTMINFWDAINRRDWQRVWDLGGSNLGGSYTQMINGYDSTADVSGTVYQDDGQQVAVAVLARESDGRTQLYRGDYHVVGGVIQTGALKLLETDSGGGFASFAGEWGGHGRGMTITMGGIALVSYRTYNWCQGATTQPCDAEDGDDILDGGLLAIRLASVSHETAEGRITWSTDPRESGAVTFTLRSDQDAIRTSVMGGTYFCGPGSPEGLCGA
jgi:hypothetical protein